MKVLLLPDLVLAFNISKYAFAYKGKDVLFNKRCDSEAVSYDKFQIPHNAETRDWPTMEKAPSAIKTYNKFIPFLKRIDNKFNTNLYRNITDNLYKRYFKNIIIRSGISFVNKYHTIYSTRLHVAILAALLNKKVYMIDNSYGKIKGVYNLWMKDLTNIEML